MPDFWQFPTVSMGLGPMTAIFQARFVRYLEHRGIVPATDRKVWAFLGDGEMDEPESMGALTMPVREKLDNLIFVINCNLQRLDGPVRGNGKIIQELEAAFLGAGWNVIKVLWGSRWDPLLARDQKGLLKRLMEECVDGEYQNFKSKGGAYTRESDLPLAVLLSKQELRYFCCTARNIPGERKSKKVGHWLDPRKAPNCSAATRTISSFYFYSASIRLLIASAIVTLSVI